MTAADVGKRAAARAALAYLRPDTVIGVVACGIFAHRRADVILVGRKDGSMLALAPDDEGSSR